MWVSGSARRSITVRSTSVASPSVRSRTILPVGVGQLAHDARHALEQRLDRLGADRHHAFLDFAGQLLERAQAGGDARRARQPRLQHALRQHRLVDHQFADEIDQAIDALEIDADRRARSPLPVWRLRSWPFPARRRARRRRPRSVRPARRRSAKRSRSRRRTARSARLRPARSPQARRRRRRAIDDDLQLAIVDDEFEQLVDRRLVFAGRQLDAPGEIGAFGVEGVERRHVPRVAFDAEFAHARQFAQQTDRLVALAIEVGAGMSLMA